MIIQFNFKNYKSFRDEATLDLSATKMTEFSERVVSGTFWGQAPLNFYKIINSIHRLLIVYKPDFCRKTSIKYPSSPVIDGLAGLLFCRIFGKHKIIRQIA
jgi:AAA15 family ATPase/GTPase